MTSRPTVAVLGGGISGLSAANRLATASSARVILRLQNMSRLPTGTLLLEDRLPYALGSRPRVVLERLGARCPRPEVAHVA